MVFLNVRTRFCCHIDLLTHREAVISEQLVTASLRFIPAYYRGILLDAWRLSRISFLLSVSYIVTSLSQCRVLYTLGITIINIQLMIYAYIRVSSDKQTTENQRYELQRFAMHELLHIDRWIEETVSGGRNY